MKKLEINAWFFVLSRENIYHNDNHHFRIKALMGFKHSLLKDPYKLQPNNVYTLEITRPHQCTQASILKSGHEVFINGTISSLSKTDRNSIQVRKIMCYSSEHLLQLLDTPKRRNNYI